MKELSFIINPVLLMRTRSVGVAVLACALNTMSESPFPPRNNI